MEEAAGDVVRAVEWLARSASRARQVWRAAALFVGYVFICLVLDRLSFIQPLHGIGITPWNPSTGIMLALLIIKGPRWFPVALIAEDNVRGDASPDPRSAGRRSVPATCSIASASSSAAANTAASQPR
jgi:hypothetical protein